MSDLREALEKLATVLRCDAANQGTDVRHPRVVLENRAADVERLLTDLPATRCTKTTYGGVYGVVPCNEALVDGKCPQNQQHFIDDRPVLPLTGYEYQVRSPKDPCFGIDANSGWLINNEECGVELRDQHGYEMRRRKVSAWEYMPGVDESGKS